MHADKALTKFITVCKEHNLSNILDIGAGETLPHTKVMRKHGLDVETVDLVPNSTYVGNYNAITFNKQFDGIWCSHTLEHQLNPGMFLRKVFTDAKEGGAVCITVPPLKHQIVSGHLTLWNAGLLLYNMIIAGFDCSQAMVKTYGYNVSVLVIKKSYVQPKLTYNAGDLERLKPYFPLKNFNTEKGFNGKIDNINWK